ncbi:hypothetical protein ABFP60_18495 [Clostridioides difficile]
MTVKLKDLYFGRVDGDTESNNENFLDLFYKGNNKYNEIANDPMKFLVHGEKGTGKTILGRYIEKSNLKENKICKIYNKDDIILGKLIEKENQSLQGEEAIYLFKWIIYYMIYNLIKDKKIKYKFKFSKKCIEEYKRVKKYKKSIGYLKRLYEKRYPSGNLESISLITDEEEEVQSNLEGKIKKSKLSIKGTKKIAKNNTYKRTEFYKLIENVQEKIVNCLRITPVVVILDDLDELDIDFDEDKKSAIALNKLIDAFKNINLLFNKEGLIESKCILLIRTDIIEELNKRSTNLNKIIQDNAVELYWIEKENKYPEKHMLMEMILNKIKLTCEEYRSYSNVDLYNKLFPEKIAGYSAINYMINNSFGRPRDIISFLEIIKRRYGDEVCFKATMFKECNQSYSETFLRELFNEMKIHIELNKLETYLKLLRDFGKNKFFLSDLKKYYKHRRSNYKENIDFNEYCDLLYKFGVIGNSRVINKGTSKEKTVYSWGYRKDGNPHANHELKFSVHYGLRNTLNTK